MFVFVQYFKSNKAPTYTQSECSQDEAVARNYAETLVNSSMDVQSVEVYGLHGEIRKVEKAQWF